ncbi:triose-phosphate isomerase [Candidatus Pelagibacter sp.]|jgi:triosephosphate isomerase (TIM)|nr:triose-phosphate isomerase [Candidatus Pelagibacter sp.]
MTNKYMYFVANWKMFGNLGSLNTLNKVINFANKIKKKKFKLIYCPPSTLIYPLSKIFKKTSIEVGAQNCHESENQGAYTGQINSKMLKGVGAKYVILGHSENRRLGENDKLINSKINTAIKSGLKVIFCIGESLGQKRKKVTKRILGKQINKGLDKIKNKKSILIAYEPVWAIGSGLIPKQSELFETIEFIKSKVNGAKVLYGGSVNPKNINSLKDINNIDGFLIGGASQTPNKFIDIIKKTFN